MNRRGLKISLEGIDGAGKTTQIPLLLQHLRAGSWDVLYKPCRNNIQSEGLDGEILELIKYRASQLESAPESTILLSAARSAILHHRLVAPHLDGGGIVVCDRDVDSAVAYGLPSLRQAYPLKSNRVLTKWISGLYSFGQTEPDLTILLDVDPEVAFNRALSDEVPNERAIFTEDGKAFIRQVRQNYLDLEAQNPHRIHKIDVTNATVPEVSAAIIGITNICIEQRMGCL